jgi:hypothetical protein
MSYLIEIDEDACAAHGDCVDLAPDVFALDDVAQYAGVGVPLVIGVAGGPATVLGPAARVVALG